MLKLHTLVLKIALITQQFLQERLSLTHSFDGPHFRVLRASHGSNTKFKPLITTAWVWWTLCPNFVLLATVVPEILTRKGGCDVITPLSFIISIDLVIFFVQICIISLHIFKNIYSSLLLLGSNRCSRKDSCRITFNLSCQMYIVFATNYHNYTAMRA